MSKHKLEIAVDVSTKFGCINKVIENPFTDIDTDTLLEIWLDNTFEIIKTEVLDDFRIKKGHNFIKVINEHN